MRVGVDFRILAVGREWMNRGMGRYTQQQLAAVLAIDTDNEYVIICPPGADLSLVKDEIRESPAVLIREWANGDGVPANAADTASLLRRSEDYEAWITKVGIDVYHSTTPFLLSEPTAADFTACPLVATFYDAIPLIFPSQYLEGWAEYDTYMRTFAQLTRAARMIAISDSARQDASFYVGFPPSRIDVAFPVAEPCFRPMSRHEVYAATSGLRQRLCLPPRYALTVSHIHHTKNLGALLQGYSLVPPALRRELPLVVCCHLDEHGAAYVRRIAAGLGIDDDIVLTGLVTDDELAALYNGATLVVHPSRYEGFGLPVIEAMHCGTPVITTTASSLPEVAGDAALLVDPDDALGFADGIQELLDDPARRLDMTEAGLEQVKKFDLDQLGRATLASYRETAMVTETRTEGRPRVAVWTPLPPQQTGVADYSVELLNQLRTQCDVEVFVDDGYLPPLELLRRLRILNFTAFERRNEQGPFDAVLYQMGGSLFHHYMYEPLQRHPGIVMLHDLLWSCVLYAHALSAGGGITDFRRDVEELEGPEALARFEAFEKLSPDLDPDAREVALWDFLCGYPMLRRIVDCSLTQIVPFETAADELRCRYENANPHTVPMGVADPHAGLPRAAATAARIRLRVAPSTLVLGVFGIVHPFKRLETCIRATAELAGDHPDVRLVIVGRALDPAYEERLHGLAGALGVAEKVVLTGHVSREDFDAHLLATDVVVNLRFPFLAQMSATLMRAIAAGKPVVISDHPDWRFFPDDFCMRVAPGDDEVAGLLSHLRSLADDAGLRDRMSTAAREYFLREATVGHMADRYLRLIHTVS
ncbi:MAG TPA: glycosyltransferase [Acidimicrobiales bacterium]|nr:glycosyltransferase [Acidimicrobiales bacterium]